MRGRRFPRAPRQDELTVAIDWGLTALLVASLVIGFGMAIWQIF